MSATNTKETLDGLMPATLKVFDKVSKLNCIKDLWLCGGTAISLQLHHRLSEDLDFELLGTKKDRPELEFNKIITEVTDVFPGSRKEIMGEDHFLMTLPGEVKLSFFRPANPVPSITAGLQIGNVIMPTLQELLGMKMYVATQRGAYRDYYDIYCLLEKGCSFSEGMQYALNFSRHTIHTKDIVSSLTAAKLFLKDKSFEIDLKPKVNISSQQICERIKEEIANLSRSDRQDWKLVENNGKYNYTNAKNELMTGRWFDEASEFRGGFAVVSRQGKTYKINEEGIVTEIIREAPKLKI